MQLARDDEQATPEPLDFRHVVTAALERARRRGPSLDFDVELDPFFVVGVSADLERAVTNLLDNAVKWSPPGGTVRVQLEGNRLRVADEGPGIAEADLPHVFDRFFRATRPAPPRGPASVCRSWTRWCASTGVSCAPDARRRGAPSSRWCCPARVPPRRSDTLFFPDPVPHLLRQKLPQKFLKDDQTPAGAAPKPHRTDCSPTGPALGRRARRPLVTAAVRVR